VEEMNAASQRLQLSQTSFVNPSGLTDAFSELTNYSSANDIATLTIHVIKQYPQIFDILAQKEFDLRTSNQQFHHKISNTNVFLDSSVSPFKIIGGKTGWTPQAQGTLLLIAQAPRQNGYLITVILGSPNRFGEMKQILDWLFESYYW
jgi:D-alanyl-D-alanine carboxypeptidase (penicillin-binding protein 5/6)